MLLKWVGSDEKYSLIIQTDSITTIKPNKDGSFIVHMADGDSININEQTLDWIIKQVDNEVVNTSVLGSVSVFGSGS